MTELTIKTDYFRMLILKVRYVMVKEGTVTPNTGSNPTDDPVPSILQETENDLTREEVVAELRGLRRDQQDELVALMWLGRGDIEVEKFLTAVAEADKRREIPTEEYLLGIPLLADYWADALEQLGFGGTIDEVAELQAAKKLQTKVLLYDNLSSRHCSPTSCALVA